MSVCRKEDRIPCFILFMTQSLKVFYVLCDSFRARMECSLPSSEQQHQPVLEDELVMEFNDGLVDLSNLVSRSSLNQQPPPTQRTRRPVKDCIPPQRSFRNLRLEAEAMEDIEESQLMESCRLDRFQSRTQPSITAPEVTRNAPEAARPYNAAPIVQRKPVVFKSPQVPLQRMNRRRDVVPLGRSDSFRSQISASSNRQGRMDILSLTRSDSMQSIYSSSSMFSQSTGASGLRSRNSQPLQVAVRSTPRNRQEVQIEIAPGEFSHLRGSQETIVGHRRGFSVETTCYVCDIQLVCIADASYVLCPVCRVVSPVLSPAPTKPSDLGGFRGGVGLGMTMEEANSHLQHN